MHIDREVILREFQAEAAEQLASLEQGLVALETNGGDPELLNELFRAAHTLKGNATSLGFRAVGELAHTLEDALELLKDGRVALTPKEISALLRTVDELREVLPAALAGQEETSATRAVKANRTLRVDLGRLDQLLNLSGELAIARTRVAAALESGDGVGRALDLHRESDRLMVELQEQVMKLRMVPVGPIFRQHVRTVRDLGQTFGKQARVILEGEDVEVDTAVVELLRAPLTHMIRNAMDHGIESPSERAASGKDELGTITLRARHQTGALVVEVQDDGKGLDRSRIAARARDLGLLGAETHVDDEQLFGFIFEPGFSTAKHVSDISGRGVGMDVVKKNVDALHGSVSVISVFGKGTTIMLRMPLTLASIQGLSVRVGEETYVVPMDAVVECVDLPEEQRASRLHGVLKLRGAPLPYVRLEKLFRVGGARGLRQSVVVLNHGGGHAGLAVDELLGESQVVVKPLGAPFHQLPGVAGSSIQGNGRVALILDVPTLVRQAIQTQAET